VFELTPIASATCCVVRYVIGISAQEAGDRDDGEDHRHVRRGRDRQRERREPGEEDRRGDRTVVLDLDEFKRRCDVIVANRRTPDITDVADKVHERDVFGSD
jgi:hypothetical protein